MSVINIPIPTEKFLQLNDFLKANGSTDDPVRAIETALDYWLENASWKRELVLALPSDARGYMWQGLFLPHGTLLRLKYKRSYVYAQVQADQIIYEGESVSPSQFASKAARGTSRSAPRDLYVKRPSDADYQHAKTLLGAVSVARGFKL